MLQNIREKSQGLLAWIIVSLLIATFALWGIHSYISSEKGGNYLAQVNGQPITQGEVNAAYERLRQQQQLQLGANFSLNPDVEKLLKRQALGQMVLSHVLVDSAVHSGYRVTTEQVDKALLKIPAFQQNGQFSIERFHDVLGGMLYTQDQFLTDLKSSMLISQVQGGFVSSAFVLPNEIGNAVKLVNQKRDISYLIIPSSRFSKNLQILPNEIQDYYRSHQKDYQSPEQVRVDYLTLSLNDVKQKLHFDQTKLQQYYETNIQNYTQPVQWHVAAIFFRIPENASSKEMTKINQKAQDVYDQLKSGGNFSALAEQYSEDIASAKHGGELNWFSAGSLDPSFEKAVASLQKPEDISSPVKTGYGICIIKLLNEKKAKVVPFDKVQSQVQNSLAQKQAEQMFSDISDKLQSLVYSNPDTLDVAAKALNLDIQSSTLFDRSGDKNSIASSPKVVAAAFSNDVLHQKNNSDLIQVSPDKVVVLRIKEYKPAAILPLADVENAIQTQLKHKKAQKEAEQYGVSLLESLKNHQTDSLASLAKKYSLVFQEDKNAGRYDSKVDAAILNKAFQMPYHQHSVSLKGMVLPSGDYALIALNDVHAGVLQDSSVQERIFREEMENNYGHLDYQFYVKGLMAKAKIKFNQKQLSDSSPPEDSDDLSPP